MERLTKKEIRDMLEKYIRDDTKIPVELLEDFKERLVDVIDTISDDVIGMYPSDDVMITTVKEFFGKLRGQVDPTIDSQIFYIIDVPILIPIEVFALCLTLHKDFLAASMAQISEYLINGVLSHLFKQVDAYKTHESMLVDLMSRVDNTEPN